MRNGVKKAFTLIEILIVVVILGILAAIVIPQFTKASDDAQAGNVQTQLSTIRNMIELYRVRNNGAYPSTFGSGTWGDPAGATAALQGLRGPDYLRSDPVNPRTNSKTIVAGTSELGGAATDGWIWDNATGSIFARGWDETNKVWH
jgi:general secretion pathway protein G